MAACSTRSLVVIASVAFLAFVAYFLVLWLTGTLRGTCGGGDKKEEGTTRADVDSGPGDKLPPKTKAQKKMFQLRSAKASEFEKIVDKTREGTLTHPVLALVHQSGCGWCQKMKPYFEEASHPIGAEGVEILSVEAAGASAKTLLAKLNLTGFPTMVLCRPGNTECTTSSGFKKADEILLFARGQ